MSYRRELDCKLDNIAFPKIIALGCILFIGLIALIGCADPNSAERALHAAGYTNVKIGGHAFLGCSDGDTFRTSFEATSPSGVRVKGVVCGGWFFRGSTIRTY